VGRATAWARPMAACRARGGGCVTAAARAASAGARPGARDRPAASAGAGPGARGGPAARAGAGSATSTVRRRERVSVSEREEGEAVGLVKFNFFAECPRCGTRQRFFKN
jgi:hypothetical protein